MEITEKNALQALCRIELEETDSTNAYVRKQAMAGAQPPILVTTEFQTAGRGAGNNTWESALGQNLLFSLLVAPSSLESHHLFVLSELLAIAICQTLNHYKEGFSIKWPNDIYYEDKKVSGLLIENDLVGKYIHRSILGVGINVNQTTFLSDAPNPISLASIVGHSVDKKEVLEAFLTLFFRWFTIMEIGDYAKIHSTYLLLMYRRHGVHPFRDDKGEFMATIHDVQWDGHLILQDTENRFRKYAFKEVEFII